MSKPIEEIEATPRSSGLRDDLKVSIKNVPSPPSCNVLLPSTVTPGMVIRIKGIVNKYADTFSIRLQNSAAAPSDGDVPFHMRVMMFHHLLSLNSCTGLAGWGTEERIAAPPYEHDRRCDTALVCEADCYQIVIDCVHFCSYQHRVPYFAISYLRIDGDLTVNEIEFEMDTMKDAAMFGKERVGASSVIITRDERGCPSIPLMGPWGRCVKSRRLLTYIATSPVVHLPAIPTICFG